MHQAHRELGRELHRGVAGSKTTALPPLCGFGVKLHTPPQWVSHDCCCAWRGNEARPRLGSRGMVSAEVQAAEAAWHAATAALQAQQAQQGQQVQQALLARAQLLAQAMAAGAQAGNDQARVRAEAKAAKKAAKEAEQADRGVGQRGAVGDAAAACEDVSEEKVYEPYEPHHVHEGVEHPDPVVETKSLAGVRSPTLYGEQQSVADPQAVFYLHTHPRYLHLDRLPGLNGSSFKLEGSLWFKPTPRQGQAVLWGCHQAAPLSLTVIACVSQQAGLGSATPLLIYPPLVWWQVKPPVITYQHHLQDAVANECISSLQLESILYANQRHEGTRLTDGSRAGFFLGDAAGVGKGRQAAGMILEHIRFAPSPLVLLSLTRPSHVMS